MPQLNDDGRHGTPAQDADERIRLSDQVDFLKPQGLLVFGWLTLTTALAVLIRPVVGSDSLAWLLICTGCTLTGPVAFAAAWRRSARFRERILALDLGPVVLLQTGRILGLAMLVLYAHDELNAEFAIQGGGTDVFIGATAFTVTYMVLAMRPFPRRLFVAWNLFGLLDFVVGWTLVYLFSPTAVGVLAGSGLNGLTTEAFYDFPMSFIPMFGVPFTACLHLIALLQVRHLGAPSTSPLFRRPTLGSQSVARTSAATRSPERTAPSM
jgi:hypothetical protein